MFLTTVLQFSDGSLEGQFLANGTEKEMKRVMNLIPAISYSGDKIVKDSWMRIVDDSEVPDAQVGQKWKQSISEIKGRS